MGRLLFAGFNLVGGCVITVLLILSAKNTSYPPAVGLALALLIGGYADQCGNTTDCLADDGAAGTLAWRQ